MSFADDLISSDPELYKLATEHPFLKSLGEGCIPDAAVAKFLEQDRLFALGYGAFLGQTIARVPIVTQRSPPHSAEDEELLSLLGWAVSNGLREVKMFPATLQRLGLSFSPSAPADDACLAYIDYLRALPSLPVALTALYALEKIYLSAWSYAKSLSSSENKYAELLDNWTCAEFVKFVDVDLRREVERVGREAGAEERRRCKEVWRRVAQLELLFWEMALKA